MDVELDAAYIKRLARCSAASLSPMAAFAGGVVGQEVLKAVTGKFSPVHQFYYFDAYTCLPAEDLPAAEYAPRNTRYDDQIGVFGATLHSRIVELKYFLIGAGAIGCEMLKNWALMGVATQGKGQVCVCVGRLTRVQMFSPVKSREFAVGVWARFCSRGSHLPSQVWVTDMDTIEKSNLNRQFLFRPKDVGQLKSDAAARTVLGMNSSMRVKAQAERVGQASEHVYDDEFWVNLDGACTALDNVEARLYVDQRCVYFQKPMVDSGTLGTKGNTQGCFLLL